MKMEGISESRNNIQKLQSPPSQSIPKPQTNLNIPISNASQMAASSPLHTRLSPENNTSNKRPAGIPSSHPNSPASSSPYSLIIGSRSNSQQRVPSHSRSLSQPTLFSLDHSLPPWSTSPYTEPSALSLSNHVSMEERVANSNVSREGVKRSAGGDIAPTTRHYRSVSMDSYMGSLQFEDESLKISHLGNWEASADANSSGFNFELNSSEFNEFESKKITGNEKLAEIASLDPKRAKRILANRQSAARSKERKMRYISELQHKVQTLQTEATTLSAQIMTMLHRDFAGLTSQNNELKFRLQAMEQRAQLKYALNEALAAEVQRSKLSAAELCGEAHLSNCMAQQLSINDPM